MNCTIRLLGDVNLSSPTATVSPPPPLPTTRCQHCHRISSSSCNRRRVYPRERIPHVVPSFGEQRPEEEDPPLPTQAPMFAASDCAICLGQFAVGDEIRELPPCRHAYHVACIDIWLGSHSFCPYCCQILVVDGRFPANKREYRMINVFLP